MFVEFQVSATSLLNAQKTAIQAMKLCTPAPITVGPVEIFIDRIEFGDNALRHSKPVNYTVSYQQPGGVDSPSVIEVPGFQTQIAQPVTVYVGAFDNLLAHPNGTPDVIVPFQLTFVTDIDLTSSGLTCWLRLGSTQVELGPLPFIPPNFSPQNIPLPVSAAQLAQAVNQQLSTLVPDRVFAIDIASELPIKANFNPVPVTNAGATVDSQLQRLALRLEINPPALNPDVPWRDFYNGILDDHLTGADFSLFVGGDYIAEVIKTLVWEAVSGSLPDQLELFIDATYSNAGGRATITADVLGIYHLVGDFIKLEANPHIPITFSVPAQDYVAVDVGIPNIQDLIDRLEHLMPSWTGPIGDFVQGLINSALSGITLPDLPQECNWSSDNLHCEKYVTLPSVPPVIAPVITGLLALDTGFALTGSFRARTFTLGTLEVNVTPYQFVAPSFSCSGAGPELVAAFADDPSAYDILYAEIAISYSGTIPVYLCSATALNDPLGVFPASAITPDSATNGLDIAVHPPVPPANYYTKPYPCDLLVRTTAGARLLSIPAPPLVTQADIDRLTAVMVEKLGNCEKLIDPWFLGQIRYNPKWIVDPMSSEGILHLWQIAVRGLGEGEAVTLLDSAGKALVTAAARANTAVEVSALLAPAGDDELTIVHEAVRPADAAVGAAADRAIVIGQQAVRQVGNVLLDQPCLELHAAPVLGRRCVLAVINGAIAAFDLTNPQFPVRAGVWRRPGLRGARPWRQSVLLFGDEGLDAIDLTGQSIVVSERCETEGILDAAVTPGWVFAISEEGLRIYDSQLCRVGAMPIEGAHAIASISGKLVVAGHKGLALYDISQPRHPRLEETSSPSKVQRLERPMGAGPGIVLATLDDGSLQSLRLDAHSIEATATFPQRPWFAGSVHLGAALVRFTPGGSSLEFSRLGTIRTL